VKNIFRNLFFSGFILAALNSFAQNDTNYACSSAQSHQFDFWAGEWDLAWSDTGRGTNSIVKEYGSCVIHENFSSPRDNFFGQSFSVYNPAKKIWEQTWIDNQNSYMLFQGGMVNNEMILNLITEERDKMKRMRFTGISQNSFDWYWEASKDDGKTWNTLWLIHYKRKNIK
jgi:hypothetical protein